MSQNKFETPKELLRAYKEGFVGSWCDPEDTDKLLGELRHPLFGVAASDLYETGKGKVALLYKSVLKFDPTFGSHERQTTGDCQNGSDLVAMADGSLKEIRDIKIGDYVISAFGKKRKVTNTFKKPYNKKMVELTLSNHTKVASTPDHKYIIDNITMKTKAIGLLEVGDSVFMPQVDYEEEQTFDMSNFHDGEIIDENTDYKKLRLEPVESGYIRAKGSRCHIKRYVALNEKLCWLLGLYAAEGGVDGFDGKAERVTFNLGGHESVIAEQVRSYIKEIFDIDAHIYQVSSKPTVIYARINSVFVANLFKHLINGNTYTKRLGKELFITTKQNKLALIKGWLDGDGYQGRYQTVATSVSKDLILDFSKIANDVNLNFSISKQDMSHDDHRQDVYRFKLTSSSSNHIACAKTEYVTEIALKSTIGCMIKILDINIVEPEENFVYCIEVEKDHNFICNGIGINNCVSHSTRNSIDVTRCHEIIGGQREDFVTRSATEAIYGSRGHGGQGMSCSRAARFANKDGGILLRKDYGFVDLSVYNSRIGSSWGRSGVPSDVKKEGQKHQVKTVSLINTVEQARDAIANGYAISVCSNYGFSSRRDQHGIAKKSGSWNHAMAWVAMDDSHEIYNETLFLVQNSWGVFNGGPKRFEQPDGSFWIRERDAAGMLAQNGSWVFSDVDGFPPRKVEWTVDTVF